MEKTSIDQTYVKCGDCDKHYRCTTCGSPCAMEGHYVESGDMSKIKRWSDEDVIEFIGNYHTDYLFHSRRRMEWNRNISEWFKNESVKKSNDTKTIVSRNADTDVNGPDAWKETEVIDVHKSTMNKLTKNTKIRDYYPEQVISIVGLTKAGDHIVSNLKYHISWEWQVPAWSRVSLDGKNVSIQNSENSIIVDQYLSILDAYESASHRNDLSDGVSAIVEMIEFIEKYRK